MAEKSTAPAKSVLNLDLNRAVALLLKTVRKGLGSFFASAVVTLDIDNTTIRLLETRRGKVRRWASVTLEPASNTEGEAVAGQPARGTAVRQLMASSGIKANKVTASLSGLYSVSRLLPMSEVPAGVTTQEFILGMARETMPLPVDRLYVSWQILTPAEGEARVLILGIPRDVLDGEVRALRAVGISPGVLELKAMALTRAVNKAQALILNIEPSSFNIVIVVNNIPEVMRNIAWQPKGLTVEDKVDYLASAVELTLDFYHSHHPGAPLDPATPLFITGQLSEDAPLMDKLRARFIYPIEPLAPPLEYPESLPLSQYAVNIGLALRGQLPATRDHPEGEPSPLEINLLPGVYSPWRPTARQVYSVLLVIAALTLLFPVFQVSQEAMGKTASLEVKFNALNNELERKKAEIKKREPLEKAINEYQSITARGVNFTEDAETIRLEGEKLGVKLGSISHDGLNITISVQAPDYIAFRDYLTALEKTGRFATPIPPPEGYPYTTGGTIKLEPVTGK